MSAPRSVATGDLTDRLFRALRRRSETAESLLRTLCHSATLREVELFVVGGLIRDLLLNDGEDQQTPLDIDLAVDGDPASLRAELEQAANAPATTHDRFGTASLSLPDGARIDIARTRSERYPTPGALPIVSPAPIGVDLARRDFTINAAALALTGDRAGELIDPHGAVSDIGRRLVRTLHPNSFRDDPTRLIRAARYASRISGSIERRTLADARRDREHLAALTAGRFGDAWRLLLNEPDAATALEIARRLKIAQLRDPRWIVPKAALGAAESPEQFWAVTGLLSRDPGIADWLPKAVGVNRRERDAIAAGVDLRRTRRSIAQMTRPSAVARALRRYPDSALQAAERVWSGPSGSAVAQFRRQRSSVRSSISPQRLIELGVERGPALGRWLERIEAAIWDSQLDPDDPASVARMEQRIRLSR